METTKTNFFTLLAEMDIVGKLVLTIAKTTDENMIVSILLQNDGCGDSAKKIIPPLNLKGQCSELDEGFFNTISQPIKKVAGLMVDMERFLKQVEVAKKASAMQVKKNDKEKREIDSKEKKYIEIMQKAEEYANAQDFKKAWVTLPQPNEYPQHADTIRSRRTQYSAKFAPDLFQMDSPEVQNTPKENEGLFPEHHSDHIEDYMEHEETENDF